MSGYDAWLEAPYTRRAQEEADLERFAEAEGIDFDDPELEARFERACEEWAESAAEQAAENRLDR